MEGEFQKVFEIQGIVCLLWCEIKTVNPSLLAECEKYCTWKRVERAEKLVALCWKWHHDCSSF